MIKKKSNLHALNRMVFVSHILEKMESKQSNGPFEQKLNRYRHPSHRHKLFQTIVRNMNIFCDNQNCKRRLFNNEVDYVCFRCNYDLCARCFILPTEPQSTVPLAESDSEINEDVLFIPERSPIVAKSVRTTTDTTIQPQTVVYEHRTDRDGNDDGNDDGDDDENTIIIDSDEVNDENQQRQPTDPNNAHIMVTFQSDNYDGITSEQISRIISHTHGNVFVPNHPHGQVTELKLETPPETLHQQLNAQQHQQHQQPSIRRSQRRPRQSQTDVETTETHNARPHQRRRRQS